MSSVSDDRLAERIVGLAIGILCPLCLVTGAYLLIVANPKVGTVDQKRRKTRSSPRDG